MFARLAIAVTLTLGFAGCTSDGVTGADAGGTDAALADATPDADPGVCPGQLLFTGEYVDWDSTPQMFQGIFEAEITEIGNESNSAVTAPNGRAILCLPASADSEVSFTHADYVTVHYSADAEAAEIGPYSVKGLTPARMGELFSTWQLTPDAGAAHLLVELRGFPGGEPITGATVDLGNAYARAFTPDASGDFVQGNQTTDGAYVFFANVEPGDENNEPGDGSTTVTVMPPGDTGCTGRASVELAAGQITATMFACD